MYDSKDSKNLNNSLTNNSNLISPKWFSHVKYEHLIAGISGGVISTLILQPLDLLKIRLAGELFVILNRSLIICISTVVNDGQLKCRPEYKGLFNAITTIMKQEGIKGFYRGVVPNCWGAGASWGFYFLL